MSDAEGIHAVHDFDEYADRDLGTGRTMVSEPERGFARLEWFVGIGDDYSPASMRFDHEDPHLLIAGSAGSGVSIVLQSLLMQLMSNNLPEDLEVWMLDPKNQIGHFTNKQHVRRFEAQAPLSEDIYTSAVRVLGDLRNEMERRHYRMRQHQVKNLSAARQAAARSECADLALPYILLVVGDCTSYFAVPPSAHSGNGYETLLTHAFELARKGRAAGIHMVFVTHDPKRDSLPTTIKRNCQRIGLRTGDGLSSRVIIDRFGLESIRQPGCCMISSDDGYTRARAFWLGSDALQSRLDQLPDAA